MWLRRKRSLSEVSIAEPQTKNETARPLDFFDSGPSPEDSHSQREQERILCAALNEPKSTFSVTAQVENWTCDVRPGVELTTEITAELEQTAKCPERAGASLLDFSHSGPVAGPAVVGAISIPVIGGLGGGLMGRWAYANGRDRIRGDRTRFANRGLRRRRPDHSRCYYGLCGGCAGRTAN
jgi:hypothetical protein